MACGKVKEEMSKLGDRWINSEKESKKKSQLCHLMLQDFKDNC